MSRKVVSVLKLAHVAIECDIPGVPEESQLCLEALGDVVPAEALRPGELN
jgi:hypothetical protein